MTSKETICRNKKKVFVKTCDDCSSKEKGIFCHLSSEQMDDLSQHKVVNHYKKGQTLFLQGNPCYGLFCVSEGKIKIVKVGPDGKESLLSIASGGDVIGHKGLFLQNEYYTATATVLEDSTLCFLDKKYMMSLLTKQPTVVLELLKKVSEDLSVAEEKIFSMYQRNVRERLAELLLFLQRHYGVIDSRGQCRLDIKLTRDEMASMIGTANETLIRFMTEFKEEGIVEQEGKVIIIQNTEALKEQANILFS
jgi:CRP-like cAMP-binding protein